MQQEAMRHLKTAAGRTRTAPSTTSTSGGSRTMLAPPELGTSWRKSTRRSISTRRWPTPTGSAGLRVLSRGELTTPRRTCKYALQLKPTRYEAHASLAQVYEQKNMRQRGDRRVEPRVRAQARQRVLELPFGLLLARARAVRRGGEAAEDGDGGGRAGPAAPGLAPDGGVPGGRRDREVGDTAGAIKHYTTFLRDGRLATTRTTATRGKRRSSARRRRTWTTLTSAFAARVRARRARRPRGRTP